MGAGGKDAGGGAGHGARARVRGIRKAGRGGRATTWFGRREGVD